MFPFLFRLPQNHHYGRQACSRHSEAKLEEIKRPELQLRRAVCIMNTAMMREVVWLAQQARRDRMNDGRAHRRVRRRRYSA